MENSMTHEKQFDEYIAQITPEPGEEEIQRRWMNAREVVLWRAVYASSHSISYRPFPVGCAMWGYKPQAHFSERWNIYKGANVKAFQELPKVCAETTAFMGALQDGFSRIVGMAIVGNPREEDREDLLYPCENCRLTMRRVSIIRADTHVILARQTNADSFSHVLETTVGAIWEKFNTPRADP
jgi:cytidine deaminase